MTTARSISTTARVAGAALATALTLSGCALHPMPGQQLADARGAIAAAAAAGADQASGDLARAQAKLALAPRWVNAKNYEPATWLAEQAQVDAELAYMKVAALKAERAVQAARRDTPMLVRTAQSN